jgi:hypothetical protein
MAKSFRGHLESKMAFRGEFLVEIRKYQKKALSHIKGKLGFINGVINHLWHGSKKQRGFKIRRDIVNSVTFPYHPEKHVFYDTNGLIHLSLDVQQYYLNQTINYFLSRNEDA